MILALFALSAAMVIGGVVAVIQGFPFVRLESGLSMVIAGATVASAGTVLSGLAVVAIGLRRVAHAFDARRIVDAVGTVQDGMRLAPAAQVPHVQVPPVQVPPVEVTPVQAPPVQVPAAAADAASVRPVLPNALVPAAAAGLLGGQSRTDPVFAESSSEPYAEPAVHDPMPAEAHAEPARPLPALTPPEPEPPAPAPEPEDDLFAPPEPPALRPSLDAEPAHGAQEPAREPEPEPVTREVVGRYASGGNTYVMYADGAIEADTPQGRFDFASLDELKAFVEAGGEAGNRGAA